VGAGVWLARPPPFLDVMSYQVLARKWRPRSFAEVIGQAHVLKALTNALGSGRLHHAYLFTGTRGVGKTTLARLLAKALNCEAGVASEPCGTCSACLEIDEGRFVDLIEVDAASRTRVDETRELLDNVQYAPTRARYKIYIIDEVHMFSNHSFNALLKTLEEPPPHIKFLLATTDPKRLPVTILSRCFQLNLTRISSSELADHFGSVLKTEGVNYEEEALRLIAQSASGSVRDGLSLLDQAIAHGDGKVESTDVLSMLGTVDRARVRDLLDAVVDGDGHTLITRARTLDEYAPDYTQVLAELLLLLRRIAVVHALEDRASEIEQDTELLSLADRIGPETCQLFYQIALIGRRDLAMSPDMQAGFEMCLIRMLAFRPEVGVMAPDVEHDRTAEPVAPTTSTPNLATEGSDPAGVPSTNTKSGCDNLEWGSLVEKLAIGGIVRELARNSALSKRGEDTIELVIAPQFEKLAARQHVDALEVALRNKLNRKLSLIVTVGGDNSLKTPSQQKSAADAVRERKIRAQLEDDPNIRTLRKEFDATIEAVSVRIDDQ